MRVLPVSQPVRPRTLFPKTQILDPWQLVWGQPYIDSDRLATAIAQDLQRRPAPDFRTRLLVRDVARALKAYWGNNRFDRWLGRFIFREPLLAEPASATEVSTKKGKGKRKQSGKARHKKKGEGK